MATKGEREPPNFVHQNAILCETIMKEQRHQKLYTNYSVNPFKTIHVITGKPNSKHDTEEGEEDSHFLKVIKRANQEPIDVDKTDSRLHFGMKNTAITKYMNEFWRVKEQTENMN
ncbi:hypothetical protein KUTeg_011404 [Tegillarca granosa]|uniref:Uncharacterized protein n=1 Tax=Tegillarca granosa TaxID=220873 RepID=A0ABQ9F0X0_TEGGR|nr:hypothetical protein KUTeg_011404 [Tegillarca granosa]